MDSSQHLAGDPARMGNLNIHKWGRDENNSEG